ncbi:DUF4173 domain-containing protein [Desulfosporosinus sp. PR]|uniref:DUF4153 domain-containing protein n=1 Tax=Candidatus Desulfosporosinus nitrosoreducens TaxID=3401928 RepID=UPI00280033FE|nr:DUF4173 domain-containing protein [Desulfosporosinus sp. PR]MDQ7095399.1 DUF4173 domain-containing protein [Desulfosporosinus sp. PR]
MDQMNSQAAEGQGEGFARKKQGYLLVSALMLGLLFNVLFYGKTLGLSYPLYIIALYGVLFWNMRNHHRGHFKRNLLPGIPIIALAFSYLIYSNWIFSVLNFLVIPILFVAHTLLLTANNRHEWFKSQFLAEIIHGVVARPLANCLKPFAVIAEFAQSRLNLRKLGAVGKVLAGLLFAAVLLIVIVPLLASADDIFRRLVEGIPNLFRGISLGEFVPRLLIVAAVTCLIFSYLWSLFNAGTKSKEAVSNSGSLTAGRAFLDPLTVSTMLVLLDLLYAFFIAIQFSYLFGSLKYGLPQNFTYAQYARKGFFELVVITLINLIVVLGTMRYVKVSGSRLNKVVNVLNSALVVSTFVILLSAHVRMSLYEAVYGFTYLRVLTHAFMGYLFLLLLVTLGKIWRPTVPLLKFYIVISLAAYTLLNYVNVDSIIVKNNIDRYNKGNPIDILYLTRLSYDVVPMLADFAQNTPDQMLAGQLEKELAAKKQALAKENDWQSFNISRYRAKRTLAERGFDISQAD